MSRPSTDILRRLPEGLRSREAWGNEAAYFVIFNATNALNYVYLVLMGFLLEAESFGLFGALFGLTYLASAFGNTVKMAVARHVAAARATSEGQVGRSLVVASFVWAGGVAAAVGLALAGISPLLAGVFDSRIGPVLWAVLAIALSIWVPAGYGLLQGLERFSRLGVTLLLGSAMRIGTGVLLVGLGAGVSGAVAGLALGFAGSGLLTLLLALSLTRPRVRPVMPAGASIPSMRSLGLVLVASLAVAAPTSLDVALVRAIFGGEEAGWFAGIAVMGRIVLFASVAIPFLALPKVVSRTTLGEDTSRLLFWSLTLTAAVASGTAGVLMFLTAGLGWSLVGTDVSQAYGAMYWYLPGMVAFAVVIAAIYHHVGTGNHFYILGVAAPGVAVQALLIYTLAGSLTAVGQITFAANFMLLGSTVLLSLRRKSPAPVPRQEPQPTAPPLSAR